MKTSAYGWVAVLVLVAAAAAAMAAPAERPVLTRGGEWLHGGAPGMAKAAVDTIQLMGPAGSGAPYIGDFEDGWNGWTTVDVTTLYREHHWQISDYNQSVPGDLAAWSGEAGIPACDAEDVAGGYGNSWHEFIVFRTPVANPAAPATVRIEADLQHDLEPGYDYLHLGRRGAAIASYVDFRSWDGEGVVAVDASAVYAPGDLVDGTDVEVLFRVRTDGGWSDEDCSYPSVGACQVDDITVTVSQEGQVDIVSFTDFQDGTFGDWTPGVPPGVGDFAKLWTGLRDKDPCQENVTTQVAFIDDGLVVPGTGGTECLTWCYGPQGYVVNYEGGLAGPYGHLQINVDSPKMAWPEDSYDGIKVAFDIYIHEELDVDSPGIFFTWGARSADTDNSAGNGFQDLDDYLWLDRRFVHYGPPDYRNYEYNITDMMNPGRDLVQVQLSVYELGWAFGWTGIDGTPAPYFDNVSVKVFPHEGPALKAYATDLAQDNFPDIDEIDLADLSRMHVRFDMAANISPSDHLRNDPGDSIVVDVVPVRSGAVLAGPPVMHYVIDANPLFDPYRAVPATGTVVGLPAVGLSGIPDPDGWAFDLPDTGTLFPGDVLHYYIKAEDDVAGDVRVATLPADLTGYGDFGDLQAYPDEFQVRALPTIAEDGFGGYAIPSRLFWDDSGSSGTRDEWLRALQMTVMQRGVDYDIYTTRAASSLVGNGLGGRTAGPALDHYADLLYSSGSLGTGTISNGDALYDAGDDIGTLQAWLASGERDLLLSGNNVVGDLAQSGWTTGPWVEEALGLDYVHDNVAEIIGGQTSPLVVAAAGNPVFLDSSSWIAFGGCPGLSRFDAAMRRSTAIRLAEFTDASGNPGAYLHSAATLNFAAPDDRVLTLPYDLALVYTDPAAKVAAPFAARERMLVEILGYFGGAGTGSPAPVPEAAVFGVSAAPNPFNPVVKISYTVNRPGRLLLKVYDVRGRLVRTLHDGHVATDGFVAWNGRDDTGGDVASGVYFTEARLNGEVRIEKLALVR